jgi:hypothetical protein
MFRSKEGAGQVVGRRRGRPVGPVVAMPREQRALLLAAKLRALVTQHWPDLIGDVVPVPFAGGAALISPTAKNVWVLIDETVIERDPMDQPDPLDALPALPRGWRRCSSQFRVWFAPVVVQCRGPFVDPGGSDGVCRA